MPMAKSMIVLLLFSWSSALIDTNERIKRVYFNRKTWFEQGPVFHLDSKIFSTNFPQHRNVTEHFRWLNTEIASVNRQIRLVKEQLFYIVHPEKNLSSKQRNKNPLKRKPSLLHRNQSKVNISSIPSNQRNLQILKTLASDSLFDGIVSQLIDIYRYSPIRTIECVAMIIESKSQSAFLLIKTSNGDTDFYPIESHRSLKQTYVRMTEPISNWNDENKQIHYYRRFLPERSSTSLSLTDQYAEIKNRPKSGDPHFFDMMGPILRMKYHVDPSSLSCILEIFFNHIFTCDGRIVYPHELKLLSDDNNRFVFYAVMIDTKNERQIFPLGTNHRIRDGDQIFYLFQNHPQYSQAPSPNCATCFQYDQTIMINPEQETAIEIGPESVTVEQKPTTSVEPERLTMIHSQNYIVYVLVTSLVVYVLYSIYLGRKQQEQMQNLSYGSSQGKRQSVSSRRNR